MEMEKIGKLLGDLPKNVAESDNEVTVCENCNGSGFYFSGEEKIYCDCEVGQERKNRIITDRMEQAEIPRRYRDASFDDYEEGGEHAPAIQLVDHIDRVLSGSTDGKKGLYMHGNPGTGKTHLAVATLNEAIRQRTVDGLFASVPRMLARLRPGGSNEDGYMERLIEAEFLVLDDLGREKNSDWVEEKIYIVLNERYNELLPTLVTANYAPDHLGDDTWVALSDRMKEFLYVISMSETNYREVD